MRIERRRGLLGIVMLLMALPALQACDMPSEPEVGCRPRDAQHCQTSRN